MIRIQQHHTIGDKYYTPAKRVTIWVGAWIAGMILIGLLVGGLWPILALFIEKGLS